jgi:hypothetical protein
MGKPSVHFSSSFKRSPLNRWSRGQKGACEDQAKKRNGSQDTVSQRLSFNPIQRRMVAAIASFLEHARDAFVYEWFRTSPIRSIP